MSENLKTLSFVAVAAVVAVVAWVSQPSLELASPDSLVGQLLFPDFKDPLAVTSLDIIQFDEATATVRPFKVAQIDVKGKLVWRIPSHDDYPADAKDQVASAATGLMGLKILEKAGEDQGDQQEYGVVDPDPKTVKVGATGVGLKVVMQDKDGKDLLALILGKEVKDRPGLRYVRKAGEDTIYVVEAKTDKLSTKFENWIERNLLGISTFDIKQLWISDYSVDQMQGLLTQRGEMVVGYNDTAQPKWTLEEDRKFVPDEKSPKGGEWTAVKLAEDQEVNAAKLDEMKTALDDLKIVDVARKPAGLSANLKAEATFSANREASESLKQCGFTLAKIDNQLGLYSNEGECRVNMKDGVQYVLRFGAIAGNAPAEKDDKDKAQGAKDGEKKPDGPQVNRYLFVMAEFNPDLIAKPELEPLPEAKKVEAKPAEEKKPAEGEAAAKPAEEKKSGDVNLEDAERQRVEKENKRKQDEYEQKVADGKKKVDDLNARFADWYYIISDDVYRKIHLSRDELVKKKDAKDAAKPGEQSGPGAMMPGGMPGFPQQPPFGANAPEQKPAEQPAVESKPADAKPAEVKPAEAKPADQGQATPPPAQKPADAAPAEAKAAEQPAPAAPPAEAKPAEAKPADPNVAKEAAPKAP